MPTRQVALLGHPVGQSLSPRMQNAAFAARGLDWHYAAFEVDDPVDAVAALRALGFAGANVTLPHKQAVVAACDEADGDAVNTLVFRDGRVLGFNTDREILAGIDAEHACLIGAGGAARTLVPALPADTRRYSRSGDWPPDATRLRPDRERDARARRAPRDPGRRPDGRRPRLRAEETALVAAAQAAGCVVVDGLEALVRQGAASFRLWTGLEPPVEVMRAAIRPATR